MNDEEVNMTLDERQTKLLHDLLHNLHDLYLEDQRDGNEALGDEIDAVEELLHEVHAAIPNDPH
jgi:hypothetical protein